jgi:hypothetical protein
MTQMKRRIAVSTDHISSSKLLILKRWKDLSPEQRHYEIVRAASRHGGQAVTLNLSPTFADYLLTAVNPMRQIGKRMNAELNNADLAALPILLVLEATRKDARPHLHGVFIGNGTQTHKVQQVMRQAVGNVTGRSGSRQFMAKNLYAADGWAGYMLKDGKITRRLLALSHDTRLSWVSRAMTQLAQNEYEDVRLGLRAASNSNSKPRLHGS